MAAAMEPAVIPVALNPMAPSAAVARASAPTAPTAFEKKHFSFIDGVLFHH